LKKKKKVPTIGISESCGSCLYGESWVDITAHTYLAVTIFYINKDRLGDLICNLLSIFRFLIHFGLYNCF